MRFIHCVAICLGLGACTQLPDIPDPVSGNADAETYPGFVPLENVALTPNANDTTAQNVDARVANLRARAARLKDVEFD